MLPDGVHGGETTGGPRCRHRHGMLPAVRALIERGSEEKVRHGAAMVAVLVPETRPDRGPFDLQFKVIANGEN